ncbi:regulatory protein, luxR family [Agreia bicolorata]|uniref:Regulatory protein, luxR family n=1 Tax=Agreia bicolorata TaxID=110935 RepID=A0A1T4WWV5_9MICO|nr:LuxR family transcriptional regulator [Agreia bicolorata]SKA81796.1 regulatory protein, luxR family [Agreia bicolorata]
MTPIVGSVGGGDSERAARFTSLYASTFRTRGWREAQPLIEKHWHEFALTEPEVLLDAIKMLPSEALIENPTRLIGVDQLRHAVVGTAPPRSDPGLMEYLIAATRRIVSSRAAGRLPGAVAVAVEAHRALRSAESNDLARLKSTLPHLTIQWSRAMDAGDHPAAIELYEDTYETALLFDQSELARRAASSLAWMYAEQGHTHEARSWLDRGRAIDVSAGRYDVPMHLAAALLAIDSLQRDEARAQVASALHLPVDEYWAATLWVRSLLCDSAEDLAHVELDLAGEVLSHPDELTNSGANARYLELTRWALNMPPTTHGAEAAALEHNAARDLIAAETAYRQGSFSDALRRCAPVLAETTAPRIRAGALLVTAASRFRLGRINSGVDAFRQAQALAEHESLLLTFSLIDSSDLHELARLGSRELRPVVRDFIYPLNTPRQRIPSLSRRERQVLGLLSTELSNAEIAEHLFVTSNTLKSTLRNVYRKLEVHDRQSASELARLMGIDRGDE